jgi:hypothetical protein
MTNPIMEFILIRNLKINFSYLSWSLVDENKLKGILRRFFNFKKISFIYALYLIFL